MKRIIFFARNFDIGGAEISSVRMMNALAERGLDVTLVTVNRGGSALAELDKRIVYYSLLPCEYFDFSKRCRGIFTFLFWGVLQKLLKAFCVISALPGIARLMRHRYDVAAVLVMNYPQWAVNFFVRSSVRLRWVRNDLSAADPTGAATRSLRRATPGINRFICVSEVARRSLVAAVPEAADKSVVIYNILNAAAMRARAEDADPPFPPSADGAPVVLSVCRLSERAKALRRMARVCRALADAGVLFHWYVAGDGPDRPLLEQEIDRLGIAGRMTLLGRLENPFPAYRAADLVAMLSNYEGLCGVVNEARVLGKAVIATQVSGIDEQLQDGVNGAVVAQDEEAIVSAMSRLLTDPNLRARLAAGGYPAALLDDVAKLHQLEAVFFGAEGMQ